MNIDRIEIFTYDSNKNKIFTLNIQDFKENLYYLQNPMMFAALCKALHHHKLFTASTILTNNKNISIYDWICNAVSNDRCEKFSEKLYWILHDLHDFPECMHPECHNKLNSNQYNTIAKGYDSYCSIKCKNSSPIIRLKRQTTYAAKSAKQKQIEIEKRLATYNKHKAEDPEFVKRQQEKSIATRKKNHGEDYTGRQKCR